MTSIPMASGPVRSRPGRSSASRPSCNPAGTATLLALLLLSAAVSGCASTIADRLPTAAGGLPENAPERPAVAPAFPAVHDMPPQRASAPLSNEEQRKLQQDLIAARNRVEGDPASTGTAKPAAASDKNP